MMQNRTTTGFKKGKSNFFRNWFGKIAAPVLVVFPVPGEEFFRSNGIYLNEYFEIAANPREANVLLAAGPVNKKLAQKIAVVYLQMPRPRAFVTTGIEKPDALPEPDFSIKLNNEEIEKLKASLVKLFQNPFRENAEAFQPEFIKKMMKDEKNEGGHQHQNHQHHHEKSEQKKENQHHNHHEHEHSEGNDDNENHEHHEHDNHQEQNHDNHDHESHGGGGMGFMSMVKMTKDMPHATDGLPMERNQAWFGPFFPGLTGGLAFRFMLDGDTVIKINANRELFSRHIHHIKSGPAGNLPQQISELNPLAPNTYRILGEELLKKSNGKENGPSLRKIILLEQERIISHLNWLSTLGVLLGNHWIEKEAAWQMQLFQEYKSCPRLPDFTQKILRFNYLKKRLQNIGKIPETLLHHVTGPVAKAAGKNEDIRRFQKIYKDAGFNVISLNENNAWGRLKIRLLEIYQSLELIHNLANQISYENRFGKIMPVQHSVSAELEGPAGKITADIEIQNGKPVKLGIKDPSAVLLAIAEEIVQEMELSDALLTIASLNINPFTINGFCIQNKTNENDRMD